MKKPGVYILQSEKNKSYYIGSTDDIGRRIGEHNSGYVSSTKNIRPLKLKLFQPCNSLTEARKIEYRVKKMKRRDYIEKMIKNQKITLGP